MTTYHRIEAFDHAYYINEYAFAGANRPFDDRPSHLHYTRHADLVVHLPTNTLTKCRFVIDDFLRDTLINKQYAPSDGIRVDVF